MAGERKPRAHNYTFGIAEGIRLVSLPRPGDPQTVQDQGVFHEQTSTSQFEHPSIAWVPLARGPFLFRRRLKKDRTLTGTSDSALLERAQASFSDWGPRVVMDWDERDPPCRLRLNRTDGYIRLEFRLNHNNEAKWFWLELHPTSIPASEELRENVAGLVPHQNRRLVLNCLMQASMMWQGMVEEFREAVASDACRIYARWGSVTAPSFTHIPRDVFHQCSIENWGGQTSIGGRARARDGTMLLVGRASCNGGTTMVARVRLRSLQRGTIGRCLRSRRRSQRLCSSLRARTAADSTCGGSPRSLSVSDFPTGSRRSRTAAASWRDGASRPWHSAGRHATFSACFESARALV